MRAPRRAWLPGAVADRKARPSPAQRRAGYVVSIAVDAVLLWAAHRILAWGWFPFLTPAWTQVLPVLTASLVVAIVVTVLYLGYDGVWFKASGDMVQAGFGVAVSVKLWRVFPFDLAGYAFPWDTVVRVLVVLSVVGSAVAVVVSLGRLVRAASGGSQPPPAAAPRSDEPASPAV